MDTSLATGVRVRGWQRLRPTIQARTVILWSAAGLVVYLALVPMAMLLWGSFRDAPPGVAGEYTLANYLKAYSSWSTYTFLGNSVLFATGSCLLAFTLGTTLAWLVERTNMPGRQLVYALALVPLAVPGILLAVSWQLLLSPKIGYVNVLLMHFLGLKEPLFNVYTMGGMIWIEGLLIVPMVFVLMAAALRSMDPALEQAAALSGAGIAATVRRVTLPMMLPAILSVLLLSFLRGMEAFEVPALVGLPGGVLVFTTKIYGAIRDFPPDYGLGTAFAMLLIAVSVVGVFLYGRATRVAARFSTVTGRGYRPRVIDLGAWRYAAAFLTGSYFLVALGLPLFIMVWGSLMPFYQVPALERLGRLSLVNYAAVWGYPGVTQSVANSLLLGVTTSTMAVLLSVVIAWIVVRTSVAGRQMLDAVAFLPYAYPGIALAVALLWVYVVVPLPIYGTLLILLAAYVTKYMPYGVRVSSASMIQIHRELEEAGETSGGSWLQVFLRVLLPLMRPGLLAAWLWIFMLSVRELGSSILLYSVDSRVLSIMIFDLWEAGQPQRVSALGVMMITVMVVLAFAIYRLGVGRRITE